MVLHINCLPTGYSKLWKSLVSSKPPSISEWSCRSGLPGYFRPRFFDVMRRCLLGRATPSAMKRSTRLAEIGKFPNDGNWSANGHRVAAEPVRYFQAAQLG